MFPSRLNGYNVTDTLKKLDSLLSADDEHYYSDDLFLEAEELIATLSAIDIPLLTDYWKTRNERWCERFSQASADIDHTVLRALLSAVIGITPYHDPILSLFMRLPKEADHSTFYDSLLGYSENLWHTQPELHRQIQMSCWSCGLSRRLLNRLGFLSWADVSAGK